MVDQPDAVYDTYHDQGTEIRQESGGKEAHIVGTMHDQCCHVPPNWGCPRVSSLLESYGYFQGKMAYNWQSCMQGLARNLIDKLDKHLLS